MRPPKVDAVQSAPDVFSKIVFSACIARVQIWDLVYFVNSLDIDAAAATHAAEEEPSPTPEGISDFIWILIPRVGVVLVVVVVVLAVEAMYLAPNLFIIFFARNSNGYS